MKFTKIKFADALAAAFEENSELRWGDISFMAEKYFGFDPKKYKRGWLVVRDCVQHCVNEGIIERTSDLHNETYRAKRQPATLGELSAELTAMAVVLHFSGLPKTVVDVADITEAQKAFVSFRDGGNEIGEYYGASAMRGDCGTVRVGGRKVAEISYNGRVWTTEDRLEGVA